MDIGKKRGEFLKRAHKKARTGDFELSYHAEIERGIEKISISDIENVLSKGEILELYLDDPRGESCLFSGEALNGIPVHVVCGNFHDEKLLIITVYIPKPPKWITTRMRRKEGEK